jgi:hypothetical protein
MTELAQERKKFLQDKDTSKYSRLNTSINIMDDIESKKIHRFSLILTKSLAEKRKIAFSNLYFKKYRSQGFIQEYTSSNIF